MRGASADSLAALTDDLGRAVQGGAEGGATGQDLFAVAALLHGEPSLRRVLTDLSKGSEAKAGLARSLLSGKIGSAALELVATAAGHRWAATRDLADALEYLGVVAVVRGADVAQEADRLENELFGVARMLVENPGLRDALADPARSVADKQGLLHGLLEGKVAPATLQLVDQGLASSHRSLQVALEEYQKVAATQRNRLVATVHVAKALGGNDADRLVAALTAQYGRPVHLNQVVDPAVLGGIRVEIGDDVIDGTIVSRLDDARRRLAG